MTGFGDWLVDTFIYTGLLIALVLLLRRPVSRWCGPQVAYALWALPFLRFIMPPIVLPAWMAPAEPEVVAEAAAQPLMVIISDPAESAAAAPATTMMPEVGIAVTDLLLPIWIVGALVFLGWRVREYVAMRRNLLAEAIPVGDADNVRLVETPAVSGPVAFGIADKVVALPPAFMAHHDIQARDMAIAHELAHHRGYDLVANIAAQPLLALHWFNPLAWWGWRAMRRDQEAACDARVVAGRAWSERAAYAEVIAGFAAGDHLALAAPMACPVLGEKSIIHRLRSLTMSEVSSGRRRLGILAITTTALALPLTASISYAQGEPPLPPEPPVAPQPPAAPLAPAAPKAPEAPAAPTIETIDPDERVFVQIEEEDGERRVIQRRIRRGDGEGMSEAEIEQMMAELEREFEGIDGTIETAIEIAMAASEEALAGMEHHRIVMSDSEAGLHNLEIDCNGEDTVVEQELEDGRHAMVICRAAIRAEAAEGLREARDEIASDPDIPENLREEILRSLDRSLERMSANQRQLQHRVQAKRDARPALAPNARASAVAMRWQGRMVSPIRVQAVAPAPAAAPAPVAAPAAAHEDCEDSAVRA